MSQVDDMRNELAALVTRHVTATEQFYKVSDCPDWDFFDVLNTVIDNFISRTKAA